MTPEKLFVVSRRRDDTITLQIPIGDHSTMTIEMSRNAALELGEGLKFTAQHAVGSGSDSVWHPPKDE